MSEQQNTFLDVESLPCERLLQLAEENFVKVNYSDAEYLYTLCLQKDPQNEEASSQFAECLKTQGRFDEAIAVLEASITALSSQHTSDYKKFLQLAELRQEEESIKLYEEGIKQIQLNVEAGKISPDNAEVKRDLSEAYAGIAEVYQTCFLHLAESEPKVVECIRLALEADPNALEGHLQQANYYLNKENEEEARKSIRHVIERLQTPLTMIDEESYDDSFKVNAAKICVELEEFLLPVVILENVVLSNDSNLEAHYLLAFCEFKCEHFYSALEYVQSLLANPDLENDEEIATATKELKDAIDSADFTKAKDGEGYDDIAQEGEDDENCEEWMDLE